MDRAYDHNFVRQDSIHQPLYVITVVFNPKRYRTRWALYKKFEAHVIASGGTLYTVEVAFGERDFVVTEPNNVQHLQLRTENEIWIKENCINLAVQRLPSDWKYFAYVDADITFARPDWVGETLHQLQHYKIVQMFSEAQDLSYNYEPFMRHQGFVCSYLNNVPKPTLSQKGYYYLPTKTKDQPSIVTWHPGFCWSMDRDTYTRLGGLIDIGVLGASDNHMAKSLVGDGEYSYHPDVHQVYKNNVLKWQERALYHVRKDIGYVNGLILHHWHGTKADRRYWDRWKILTEFQFNPDTDLKKDWQGMYQLEDYDSRQIRLRDKIREYFALRNEDNIMLNPTEIKM